MKRRRIFTLIAALLTGCAATAAEEQELRVLMIGNSYTGQTRAEVKAFLDADPAIKLEFVTHTPGGRKLADHAKNPKVAELISDKKGWNVIVLQDQSQLPAFAMAGPEGNAMLRQLDAGGPVLLERIHDQQPKTRVILFETWARYAKPDKRDTLKAFEGRPERMQDALTKGYQRILKNPGKWDHSKFTTIAPVGTAWESWYAEHGYDDEKMSLHKPDRSHPGKLGAYLTGAVIYQSITGRAADKLGYDGGHGELAKTLLAHARKVMK
jgi:hypothetical protein